MPINAINSMSFKGYNPEIIDIPQEDYETSPYEPDFGSDEFIPKTIDINSDIEKMDKAEGLVNKLVDSEDIKGPFAAITSVIFAGAKTFAHGAGVALGIDTLFKQGPSRLFEKGLKFGAGKTGAIVETLKHNNGKLKSIANRAGNLLDNIEYRASNIYQKISKNSTTKGLAVISGVIATLTFLPALLKRDNNEDGVSDIMQKSQNAYTQSAQKLDKLQEKAGIVAELVELVS